MQNQKARDEFKANYKKQLENKNNPTVATQKPIIVSVDNIPTYIFNHNQNKFIKITKVISKLKDFQLHSYYQSLQTKSLDSLNEVQHFLLTQNELVKRGLIDGGIEILNNSNSIFKI